MLLLFCLELGSLEVFGRFSGSCVFGEFVKEFHRRDFANRTGLAQAWTVKSADRLFT